MFLNILYILTFLFTGMFLVAWLVLLICCLKKKQFCPVFGQHRPTRSLWLGTFIFMNPLLMVLYLVYGQIRPVHAPPSRRLKVIVMVVILAGFFVGAPGIAHGWRGILRHTFSPESENKDGFHANAAKIEARTNSSSSNSSCHSDNTRVNFRTILLINKSDHYLAKAIGPTIKEELEKSPYVDTVVYCDSGLGNIDTHQQPSAIIELDLEDIDEGYIPLNRSLDATVNVSARSHFLKTRSYTIRSSDPPGFNFDFELELKHQSKTLGYEAVPFTLAKKDIAKEITKQISKYFNEQVEKFGELPELPEYLYPEYEPWELPGEFEAFHLTKMLSGSGLLFSNETIWATTGAQMSDEDIEGIITTYEEKGWKSWKPKDETMRRVWTLSKNDEQLLIIKYDTYDPMIDRKKDEGMFSSGEPGDFPIYLVYHKEPERAAYQALIGRMLDDKDVTLEALLLFYRGFNPEQRKQFYSMIERIERKNLAVTVILAEYALSEKKVDRAIRYYKDAVIADLGETFDSPYKGRVDSIKNKLKKDHDIEVVLTYEDVVAAGCYEADLTAVPEVEFQTEATYNEPIQVACKIDADKFHVVTLQLLNRKTPTSQLVVSSIKDGMKYCTSNSTHSPININSAGVSDVHITTFAKELEEKGNFAITIHIKKDDQINNTVNNETTGADL